MSEKESPFSLFSSSKNKPSAKDSKEKSPADLKKKSIPSPHLDPQTENAFEKILQMQSFLKDKVDEISRKSGLTQAEVFRMANSRPQTQKELEKMHADIQLFQEKVWGAVGRDIVPRERVKDPVKNRKTKTLGARHNWMRME